MLAPQRTGIGNATRMLIQAFARAGRKLSLYWRHRPDLDWLAVPPTMRGHGLRTPVGYMTVGLPGRLLWDGICLCHFTAGALPYMCPTRTIVTGYDLSWHRLEAVFEAKRAAELRACFEPRLLRADHIIAVSEHTRNDIIDVYGLSEEHISIVPLGVDQDIKRATPDEVFAVRARYQLASPYLLYTGTFHEHKNVEWLINCYARAFPQRSGRPQLILAGPPVPRSAEVTRLLATRNLSEDVRYLGYVPRTDIASLLTAATAYVFPSLYEGFGLPPLEAMACGTPVVSSTGGALKETVGDAALLISPTDDEMLIEALRRIVEDETLRCDLVQRGHQRVKHFNWDRTAELTWQVYERVLEGCSYGNCP